MLKRCWTWLQAHSRKFLVCTLGFLCLSGLLYGTALSSSNRQCQADRATNYAKYDDPDFFEKSGTFFVCEGVTIDANGELLTAIATIVMAIFTGTLWLVTDKALRLAREEFNVTRRPKIIVRNFQLNGGSLTDLTEGEAVTPIFIAQNIGDSPGTVIEVRSATIVLKSTDKIPTDISFAFREPLDFTLASGQRELVPANGGSVPTNQDFFDIFADTGILYCLGTLVYVDGSQNRRETGFCRRYLHRENRWEPVESEYEYAY